MTIHTLPNHMLRREIHNTVIRIMQMQDDRAKELLQKLLEEAAYRNLH